MTAGELKGDGGEEAEVTEVEGRVKALTASEECRCGCCVERCVEKVCMDRHMNGP